MLVGLVHSLYQLVKLCNPQDSESMMNSIDRAFKWKFQAVASPFAAKYELMPIYLIDSIISACIKRHNAEETMLKTSSLDSLSDSYS